MRTRAGAVLAGLLLVAAAVTTIYTVNSSSEVDPRPTISLRTVLDADFEQSSRELWSGPQAAADDRVTPVPTVEGKPVKSGSLATRFEVRPGDSNVAGSGEGERAEVYLDEVTTGAGEGVEQWWAWSTYFPSDFDSPGGGWNTFTGFHHTGTTGQVPIQFTANDKTSLTLRVMGGSVTEPTRKDFTLAQLQRGKWYDFVFHVKWSSSGAGFVEVWLDGSRVVPLTTTPTLYVGQGVYLKQGYYRHPYNRPSVVFHDGMRRLVPDTTGSASREAGVTLHR